MKCVHAGVPDNDRVPIFRNCSLERYRKLAMLASVTGQFMQSNSVRVAGSRAKVSPVTFLYKFGLTQVLQELKRHDRQDPLERAG